MSRRMLAALLSVAVLISILPMTYSQAASTRVTRCNLRLRAKPTTDSDTLATVPGGTEVSVLGTSGGWTQTTYNGHTGYISTNHLMDLTRSGYYPLKEGDENPYVKDVQLRLIELGYLSGTADGKYESKTKAAVSAFQKANGLGQDGIAGGGTQSALFGDTAKGASGATADPASGSAQENTSTAATASGDTLKKGSRGDEVQKLQARLIELGYLSGKADGVYGVDTEKAVMAFQKRSSLSADGKAGLVTQSLLFSTGAVKADGSISGSTQQAAEDVTYKSLKKGVTSDDVKKLQVRLKELGYFSNDTTGYYGNATQIAVQLFQQTHNLTADGVAGQATQMMLFSTEAKKASASSVANTSQSYQTLKQGMKSTAVTTMQKKLKELGYFDASTTGLYGSVTKEAVIAFQKRNGLTADGVAGSATLNLLYSGIALAAGSSSGTSTAGKISGPVASSVKLLHWFDSVKPSLKSGSTLLVYDPSTGYGWNLRAMSLGRHCDAEPITAEDTLYMNTAFGNKTTWTPKIVYVKLPSGTWTMATMHNTPHLSGGIKNNNFDGHLCVHFLRDMAEATKNDPNYGVQNQKALRTGWKSLTGNTVD